MNQLSKLLKSYIFFIISALGISLNIKAGIGISCFNAMNLSIANVLGIKIGTVATMFNLLFLIVFIVLSRFKYIKKYFLQLLSIFIFGSLINVFTYTLLADLVITEYGYRLLAICLGTVTSGLSVGMIIYYNQITFPLESLCIILAEKTRFKFVTYRYGVDVIAITVSLLLTFLNDIPLFVREGTVISLLILSACMNLSGKLATSFTTGKSPKNEATTSAV